MRDQTTATEQSIFLTMTGGEGGGEDFNLRGMMMMASAPPATPSVDNVEMSSMLVETGSSSRTSLNDDFHSPVDSDERDEEACLSMRSEEDGFGYCKDAVTDTEDLSWMISIGRRSERFRDH